MAASVVEGAFLVVAEDVIGFSCFLKFFFSGLVTWVFVRVELDRFFTIGFFYFVRTGVSSDPQYFIIISFGHKIYFPTTTLAKRMIFSPSR